MPKAVKNAISERLPEKGDLMQFCIEYMITASPEWQGWMMIVSKNILNRLKNG
jgi:hypothetical protein